MAPFPPQAPAPNSTWSPSLQPSSHSILHPPHPTFPPSQLTNSKHCCPLPATTHIYPLQHQPPPPDSILRRKEEERLERERRKAEKEAEKQRQVEEEAARVAAAAAAAAEAEAAAAEARKQRQVEKKALQRERARLRRLAGVGPGGREAAAAEGGLSAGEVDGDEVETLCGNLGLEAMQKLCDQLAAADLDADAKAAAVEAQLDAVATAQGQERAQKNAAAQVGFWCGLQLVAVAG